MNTVLMSVAITSSRLYGLALVGEAKWNKSDRERQILYVIYLWNLKIQQTNRYFQNSKYNKKEADSQI